MADRDKELEFILKFRNEADAALRAAGMGVSNLGTKSGVAAAKGQALSTSMKGIAVAGAGVIAAMVGVAASLKEVSAGLDTFREFEKGMANVQTLMPDMISLVDEFGEQAREMAITTGIEVDKMTESLYSTVSALGATEESFDIMAIAAKTAVAGLADAGDAVRLLTGVTKAFGDTSAVATQEIADMAFATVRLGVTTIPELANSITQATGTAKLLGVETKELFGAMATLTGVTGNTSEVATQLRAMFIALLRPTDTMKQLYKELGVTSGEALVAQNGLAGALVKISTQAKDSGFKLVELLGRVESLGAVSFLSGEMLGTFNEKMNQVENSAGSMQTAFEIQAKTLDTAMNRMGTAFNEFQVTVGATFAPIMHEIADLMTDMALGFRELEPNVQKAIAVFIALAPALAGVTVAFIALKAAMASIALLVGPVGWIALGLSILVPGLIAMGMAMDGTGEESDKLTLALKRAQDAMEDLHDASATLKAKKELEGALVEQQAALDSFNKSIEETQAKIDKALAGKAKRQKEGFFGDVFGPNIQTGLPSVIPDPVDVGGESSVDGLRESLALLREEANKAGVSFIELEVDMHIVEERLKELRLEKIAIGKVDKAEVSRLTELQENYNGLMRKVRGAATEAQNYQAALLLVHDAEEDGLLGSLSLAEAIDAVNQKFKRGPAAIEAFEEKLREQLRLAQMANTFEAQLTQTLDKVALAAAGTLTDEKRRELNELVRKVEAARKEQADAGKADKDAPDAAQAAKDLDALIMKRNEEIGAIGKGDQALREYNQQLELANIARKNNVEITAEQMAQFKDLEDAYKTAAEAQRESEREFFHGLERAAEEYVDAATNAAALASKLYNATADGFTETLADMFDGTIENMEDLRDKVGQIMRQIGRMLIEAAIRATIVKSITQTALFPGAGGGGTTTMAALGAAYDGGGIQKFANGTVINQPTLFGTKSGLGLMGEEGPEAIMPLKRMRDGSLGITAESSQRSGGVFTYSPTFTIDLGNESALAANKEDADRLTKGLDAKMRKLVMDTIRDESRPGGNLNQGV